MQHRHRLPHYWLQHAPRISPVGTMLGCLRGSGGGVDSRCGQSHYNCALSESVSMHASPFYEAPVLPRLCDSHQSKPRLPMTYAADRGIGTGVVATRCVLLAWASLCELRQAKSDTGTQKCSKMNVTVLQECRSRRWMCSSIAGGSGHTDAGRAKRHRTSSHTGAWLRRPALARTTSSHVSCRRACRC